MILEFLSVMAEFMMWINFAWLSAGDSTCPRTRAAGAHASSSVFPGEH